MRFLRIFIVISLFVTNIFSQNTKHPEQYFGHVMGADSKLIGWDQIVEYFKYLDARSDRMIVEEIGKTTLGKPFIMATFTAAKDMPNLARYKEIQQRIGRAENLSAEDAAALIDEGKTVIIITLNIHSTEIAASQESVELAYELATRTDERVKNILDNVIILMVPSLNPDGQQMIVDFYKEIKGTAADGSRYPGLYHHYAGHDNNRDWFFFNLVESQNVAKILYKEWYPEIVYDQHQMGSRSARLFMPPYQDPINPNVSPRLTASTNMLGNYVLSDLTDRGFTGVVTGTVFNAFFEGTMSKTPLWHNRIGILSEAASVQIATPTYHPPSSMRGMDRALNEYQAQTNFPAPWPGGWWRLRNIVEYEKAATYAILDLAANYKKKYKTTFYELNVEAIEKGKTEAPYAWVIPASQHDPNSTIKMLNVLRHGNVKIYRTKTELNIGHGTMPAGTFVIPLAQANRPFIKDLMEKQHYPNMRLYPGGPPMPPYDLTTWSLPLMMGVTSIGMNVPLTDEAWTNLEEIDSPALTIDQAVGGAKAYLIGRRWINSYILVNDLLKAGHKVGSLNKAMTVGDERFPAGSFVIVPSSRSRSIINSAHTKYQVNLASVNTVPKNKTLKPARIGIYGPFMSAYDEGWTRLLFDRFNYPYTVLRNKDFASSKTLAKYDVIIMPGMRSNSIIDGSGGGEPSIGSPVTLKKYAGGIGKSGLSNLKNFMLKGGTVLFLGSSSNFAIDKLKVPATNVLKNVSRDDFYAPGSIFNVTLDLSSPLTFGMEKNSQIYFIRDAAFNLRVGRKPSVEIAVYGDRDVLSSGWVLGEDRLYGNVAMAEVPTGKGRAILYGFRVQNRAQTYGTFRLLFNALYK